MSEHKIQNGGVALNPSQREVAFSTEKHVVVLAGAGTGKTAASVHKVAHLIRGGVQRHCEVDREISQKAIHRRRQSDR